MTCDRARLALSASLDGEAAPRAAAGDGEGLDEHLAACSACASWYAAAVRVTRLARTAIAPPPAVPDDLLAVVSAAAPGPGKARTARLLRIVLGAAGAAQFALGIGQVASLRLVAGTGAAGGMSSDHLLHESAAWNVALGAGFCWVAFRRCRPATMLPIMTAFVGVLLLLSIGDLMSGEVIAAALLTHIFVIIGYAILLLLRRPIFDTYAPPAGRAWRLVEATYDEDVAPGGQTVGSGQTVGGGLDADGGSPLQHGAPSRRVSGRDVSARTDRHGDRYSDGHRAA